MSDATILIVGAGPVGLTVAAELGRRGAPVRVVEAATGPSTTSRAIGIHARTLELLERLDLAARLVDLGVEIHAFRFHDRGRQVADLAFAGLPTQYPFALSLGQDVTERVLLDHVHGLGVEVEWGVRLESLRNRGDRVDATLVHNDGGHEQTTVSWVVGCDGAGSTVRRQLGVAFDGEPFPEWFLVADLCADADLDARRAHLFLSDAGATAVFPLPEPGLVRLATPLASNGGGVPMEDPPVVDLAAIDRLWHARVGRRARLTDPRWISPFRFHSRLAARYRVGRVFLAGDAAHVHSPVGGQGMNAGMHDAFNLAWKLDAVRRGAPDALLDSYDSERRPAAARMLAETRRNAVMVSTHTRTVRALRNAVLRTVARIGPVRRRVLAHVTMLAVAYFPAAMPGPAARSSLSGRLRRAPGIGERAPDAPIGPSGEPGRLHDVLRSPRHVLLCFDAAARDQDASPDVTGDVETVRVHRVRPGAGHASTASGPAAGADGGHPRDVLDRTGAAHRAYGVRRPTSVLVRPDGVIAWRGPLPPTPELHTVLAAMSPAGVG